MSVEQLRNFDNNYSHKGGIGTLMQLIRNGRNLTQISDYYELSEVRMRQVIKIVLGMNYGKWVNEAIDKPGKEKPTIKPPEMPEINNERRAEDKSIAELTQVMINKNTYLVLSNAGKGYLINKKIIKNNGTIYTKGIYIKDNFLNDLVKIITNDVDHTVEIVINDNDKIIFTNIKDNQLDIRHFITTNTYTGFTKKGVRAHIDLFRELFRDIFNE